MFLLTESAKPIKIPEFYNHLKNQFGVLGLSLRGIAIVDGRTLKGDFEVAVKTSNQFVVTQKKQVLGVFSIHEIDLVKRDQTSKGIYLTIEFNSKTRADIHIEGLILSQGFKL